MNPPEPAVDWFGEPGARDDLAGKSVRGTLSSAAGSVANQLIGLLTLLVLARLLAPADFGVVAMITAVIGIASVFQDLGFSGATIRYRSITHEQVSNLFWINLGAGVAMTLVVAAFAPLVEHLYGDPRLRGATLLLALGFSVNAAATQHRALLNRTLQFGTLAMVQLGGALATAAVSLLLAANGGAYWSLIAGSLAGSLVATALAWRHCSWRPARPRRGVGTRELVRFGSHLALFGILAHVARNLHNLIIGRNWGAADVGLYSRAVAITQLLLGNVTQPVGQVAPAALSRLNAEPGLYRDYYHRACTVVVILAMPIAFVCTVLPAELVQVILGARWGASAPLLQVLGIGVLAQAISFTTGWVFLSGGRSEAMLAWGAFGWSVIIVGTLVGSRFGLSGIALASTSSAFVLLLPNLRSAFLGTGLRLASLARALAGPVVAGLAAGAVAWAALRVPGMEGAWLRLLAGVGVFGALYLVLLLTVAGQRQLVVDVLQHLPPRGWRR